jgi:NADP-dependent 3-hydroxy acid dehydrogenase YdfG
VLVNNAGVTGGKGVADNDLESFDRCMNLNLRAATICMQEAIADMAGKTEAAIINISSMNAHRIVAGRTSEFYAAGKHALRVITDGARAELAGKRSSVKVAMISPGMVDTEWHHPVSGRREFKPLEPEDIAVLYILSAPAHVQICDIQIRAIHQVY